MKKEKGFSLIEVAILLGFLALGMMFIVAIYGNKVGNEQSNKNQEINKSDLIKSDTNDIPDNKPQITNVQNIDVNANPYNEKK